MFSEITITIKNVEKRLTKKFPVYEEYTVDENHPIIKGCIDETIKDFGDEPEDIAVRINLEVK